MSSDPSLRAPSTKPPTGVIQRFDRFWYPPMPAERLAALRILVGGFAFVYLLVRLPYFLSHTRLPAHSFDPVGLASILETPLSPMLSYLLYAGAVLSGAAYVLGFGFRLSGPIFAALLLWVTTYRNSWGMVFHTENLMVLHVLVIGVSPAADTWAFPALKASGRAAPRVAATDSVHGRYGWPVRTACVITTSAYLLAGLAKLRFAGIEWADGEVLRAHIAYDALRKLKLGSFYSPIAPMLVNQAWLFPPLSFGSLLLELGAPLALLGGRFAKLWSLGIWCFHIGVIALMAITFPYPVSGVAFAPFFAVERLMKHPRLRKLFRRSTVPA